MLGGKAGTVFPEFNKREYVHLRSALVGSHQIGGEDFRQHFKPKKGVIAVRFYSYCHQAAGKSVPDYVAEMISA